MKPRVALTLVWLASLVAGLVLVELYRHAKNQDGIHLLDQRDILKCIKPLVFLYGPYITGILGFWYFKPFRPAASSSIERARFWFALACALTLNLIVLFFVAHHHLFFDGAVTVYSEIALGTKIGAALSFLVAPANLYYFGMKPSTT